MASSFLPCSTASPSSTPRSSSPSVPRAPVPLEGTRLTEVSLSLSCAQGHPLLAAQTQNSIVTDRANLKFSSTIDLQTAPTEFNTPANLRQIGAPPGTVFVNIQGQIGAGKKRDTYYLVMIPAVSLLSLLQSLHLSS